MAVVLLSLGADLDISPICGNRKTPLNRSKNFSSPESTAIKEFMNWVARRREFIRGHLNPESSEKLSELIAIFSKQLPTNTTPAPVNGPSNGNLMRARLFGRKTGGRRRKNRRTRRAV
jgi:hypothetical protein